MPEEEPIGREIKEVRETVSELVRRALGQAGDLRDVEDKLKAIAEKSSKMTPPPEVPGSGTPD
jgi:hypothetical protein